MRCVRERVSAQHETGETSFLIENLCKNTNK